MKLRNAIAILKKVIQRQASAVLLAVILVVNLGNYMLNLFLGRFLGPELFAEVSMLATGMLILSFIALGFQLTAAKYVAEWTAAANHKKVLQFGRWFTRKAMYAGLILAGALVVFSPALKSFLNFESQLSLLILAPGIPLYLLLSTGRGILQGKLAFKQLAASYFWEMLGRIAFTIPAVFFISHGKLPGTSEAVSFGFLVSFLASFWAIRKTIFLPKTSESRFVYKPILFFMFMVGSYELSQILISYSDIILVKHFFSNQEAGLYAALSLVGRVVYFATWSLVTILFPKVVQLEKKGLPHQMLFVKFLVAVLCLGTGITLFCFAFSGTMITVLFGETYAGISHLLGYYAIATTLFTGANVFVYYNLSLNKYLPVVFSLMAGLLQIILIWNFHQTLFQVILLQIILMSSLFVFMLIFHFNQTNSHAKNKTRNRLALSA